METRIQIMDKINRAFAILSVEARMATQNRLYSYTTQAENFFKYLLDILYETNLINLNLSKYNFPCVDLGDATKQIAFQITAEKNGKKIRDTLKRYDTDSSLKTKYKKLYIVVISEKQLKCSIDSGLSKRLNFKYSENVVDLHDLYKKIDNCNIDVIKKIDSLLTNEIPTIYSSDYASILFCTNDLHKEYNCKLFIDYISNISEKEKKQCEDWLDYLSNTNSFERKIIYAIFKKQRKLKSTQEKILCNSIDLGNCFRQDISSTIYSMQSNGILDIDDDGENNQLLVIKNPCPYWLSCYFIDEKTESSTIEKLFVYADYSCISK